MNVSCRVYAMWRISHESSCLLEEPQGMATHGNPRQRITDRPQPKEAPEVMGESHTTPSGLPLISANRITPRETQAMEGVLRGLTNGAIASQLQISSRTVQKHLERVFRKLGVRSRSELVGRAYLDLARKHKDR